MSIKSSRRGGPGAELRRGVRKSSPFPIHSHPLGVPGATPPDGSGSPARRAESPLLEYYTSITQQSLILQDIFDSDVSYLGMPASSSSRWPSHCPSIKSRVLLVRGYPLGGRYGGDILYRGVVHNIGCKRWSCVPCAQKKVNMIRKRLAVGELVRVTSELISRGFKYPLKMFHLTLPGSAYREANSIIKGVNDLRRCQNNLMRALKREYPDLLFLCVVEPHKSGWPHLHLILGGEGIAKSKPYHLVRNLWRDRYGMGYVYVTVKVKVWDKKLKKYRVGLVKDAWSAIDYATKYMLKGVQRFGERVRLYSCGAGVMGSMSDVVKDYGFPVFMQVNRVEKEDECLDLHNRKMDSYTLFETKDDQVLAKIRDSLGDGVFDCRVNSVKVGALEEEFPGRTLPRVYVSAKSRSVLNAYKKKVGES